ncbi:hypothetical protein I5731_14540 [Methylobrevis sp. L22]|uniref:Uncharacterized protein n=1 Tax=Methylobrevis albus TaxID=2793297 RepID=A0A931I573_9HYPH|nr:hypothetical protein [Methylobrevis albus]
MMQTIVRIRRGGERTLRHRVVSSGQYDGEDAVRFVSREAKNVAGDLENGMTRSGYEGGKEAS